MANSKLENKIYSVIPKLKKYLGDKISYGNMKMTKSRLEQARDSKNMKEFLSKGGDEVLEWIDNTLETDRNLIYNRKRLGKDAGMKNQFIKSHEKNKDLTKNKSVYKELMGGLSLTEGLDKEMNEIKYLITYLTKNNK